MGWKVLVSYILPSKVFTPSTNGTSNQESSIGSSLVRRRKSHQSDPPGTNRNRPNSVRCSPPSRHEKASKRKSLMLHFWSTSSPSTSSPPTYSTPNLYRRHGSVDSLCGSSGESFTTSTCSTTSSSSTIKNGGGGSLRIGRSPLHRGSIFGSPAFRRRRRRLQIKRFRRT